jgi:hypothetical protein
MCRIARCALAKKHIDGGGIALSNTNDQCSLGTN